MVDILNLALPYFGLIFIGFVLFAPQGIWGLLTSRLPRRAASEG